MVALAVADEPDHPAVRDWVVDASLVALAQHLRTTRVATLDHRHFRCPHVGGESFTVLPADA